MIKGPTSEEPRKIYFAAQVCLNAGEYESMEFQVILQLTILANQKLCSYTS